MVSLFWLDALVMLGLRAEPLHLKRSAVSDSNGLSLCVRVRVDKFDRHGVVGTVFGEEP